jgi:hypothetical protein
MFFPIKKELWKLLSEFMKLLYLAVHIALSSNCSVLPRTILKNRINSMYSTTESQSEVWPCTVINLCSLLQYNVWKSRVKFSIFCLFCKQRNCSLSKGLIQVHWRPKISGLSVCTSGEFTDISRAILYAHTTNIWCREVLGKW